MTATRVWIERWAALAPGFRASAAVLWAAFLWQLSAREVVPARPGTLRPLLHNGGHVVVYAILGALVLFALPGARLRSRPVVAWTVATLYGVVDELHQSWVPARAASVGDVLSDAAGAVLGIALTLWLWREDRRAGRIAAAAIPIACLCVGVETFAR